MDKQKEVSELNGWGNDDHLGGDGDDIMGLLPNQQDASENSEPKAKRLKTCEV